MENLRDPKDPYARHPKRGAKAVAAAAPPRGAAYSTIIMTAVVVAAFVLLDRWLFSLVEDAFAAFILTLMAAIVLLGLVKPGVFSNGRKR